MKPTAASFSGLCLLILAQAFVSGCGSSSSSGGTAPTALGKGGKVSGDLEVDVFKGGYGMDFFEDAATKLMAKYPDLKVKVIGDPDIADKLRPRLVSGEPPDLMYPGWKLDHWALVAEDQLTQLDGALDGPAEDGTGKWRDTFEPSILKLGQKDGKQWVLPYFFNVWGLWYNPNVFQKNGWTVPKTFEDLLALCAKIKATGVAPITFQGKYPYYMLSGMILPWVQDIGGVEAVNDLQNLKPGAWKSPAVMQALQMICTLRDRGYFEDGAVALSHTESQTDFLNGKAAIIPCGTWLESEMRKTMPAGAKVKFMQPVLVTGGKGDPSAVEIDIEPWMIPSKAKNPEGAVAYYKFLTSLPEATAFVEQKGTLTAIKGSEKAKMPESLVEPSKAFSASKTVWSYSARAWYTGMEKEIEDSLTSLLNKEITPEQFCDRAEAAAEKTRQDSSIEKHKVE